MKPRLAYKAKKNIFIYRSPCRLPFSHCFVGLSVYCLSAVYFTDRECETCTRGSSLNSGSIGACDPWLSRGARFVSLHLEVVAIAGLMWFCWCIFGVAGFRRVIFVFFFKLTRPATGTRPPWLIRLSTAVVPGCVHVIQLTCVCLCTVCVQHSWFSLVARAVRGRSPKSRSLQRRTTWGYREGLVSSQAAAVEVLWWFWWRCCYELGAFTLCAFDC